MLRLITVLGFAAALAACATTSGPRTDWRCEGGKAFSVRPVAGGVEVFAAGQVYQLQSSGGDYTNGHVRYSPGGLGRASLTGANAGPYENCRQG